MGKTQRIIAQSGAVLAGGAGAFSAEGASTTNDAGQPVQRFRKDLLRAGRYVKASTDQTFEFTEADLVRFAATFARMHAAGVKVPMPVGHTNDPEKNRGGVLGMEVEDDDKGRPTLYGTCELVGDGIKLAGTTEVSVNIEPEFVDGKGNKYVNAITHVAIVTDPVVPDQSGFVAIAASRAGDAPTKRPAYRLAQESSNMDWKKIAAALGMDVEKMTDETAGDEIVSAIDRLKGEKKKVDEEKATVSASLAAEKAKRSDAPKPSPTEIRLSRKDREREIEGLLDAGHIDAAQAKRLTGLYIGGEDGAALALSLDEPNVQRFEEVVEILKLNPATRPNGTVRTGTQFNRNTPDAQTTEKDEAAIVARVFGTK